jgi:transposase-like protein
MSPQSFKAWMARMTARAGRPYSYSAAARDLGITRDMAIRYARASHQLGVDPPHPIPRAVALACAALESGLDPLG